MKDDYSKPSIQNLKINCDNSNRNPSDSNADPSNAFGLPNRDSQSDRMNGDAIPDHKGNFVFVCQNNNNNNNIVNVGNINNGTTINNNTLFIENNNAQEQQFNTPVSACNSASDSAASNTFDLANNTFTNSSLAADLSATASSTSTTTCNNVTANVGPIIANQSIADNDSGVITPNSIANNGQSSVQSLDVNSYQRVNGIEVQQQQQQQRTEDSHDLTAMEKVIKLKTQWLNQLP
jgi:hypothetical protein